MERFLKRHKVSTSKSRKEQTIGSNYKYKNEGSALQPYPQLRIFKDMTASNGKATTSSQHIHLRIKTSEAAKPTFPFPTTTRYNVELQRLRQLRSQCLIRKSPEEGLSGSLPISSS
jgi:hypothetical protein